MQKLIQSAMINNIDFRFLEKKTILDLDSKL